MITKEEALNKVYRAAKKARDSFYCRDADYHTHMLAVYATLDKAIKEYEEHA